MLHEALQKALQAPMSTVCSFCRMHAWLVPMVRARLLEALMSARYSCAPDICSAEPRPVTQRHASSCAKLRDAPHPTMPA